MDRRRVHALAQLRGDVADEGANQGGAFRAQAVEIQSEERLILAKGEQADLAVRVDIALADLDETTIRTQHSQAFFNGLPGQ